MTAESRSATWRSLIVLLSVNIGGGAIVGFITQGDSGVYQELAKPAFTPPGWLFPVVWTLLYAGMATAMWFVLRANGRDRYLLLGLYVAQLAVNLIWPILFFTQQALGLAFFWLVLLWMLAGVMLWQFFLQSRVAGWLLVPYQAWITFAGVLNFSIARLNP